MQMLMRLHPTIPLNDTIETMTYDQWCETYGKYRWYHENGSERLYYPLDYDWKRVYESCTKYADMYFSGRIIHDPATFTSNFLVNVPGNWLKFKTELEFFSGMLDGNTISPDLFNQGYTKDVTESENTVNNDNVKSNLGVNQTTNIGQKTDNTFVDNTQDSSTKGRSITYEQGVQAYDNQISNDNIGELGNNYASNMADSIASTHNAGVESTENRYGKQENTEDQESNYSGTAGSDGKRNLTQHEEVKRINFYDNLAFLREREDHLKQFKDFYTYFEPYFAHADGFIGAWM